MAKRDTSAARAAAAAKRGGLAGLESRTRRQIDDYAFKPAQSKSLALVLGLVVLAVIVWGFVKLSPAARMAGLVPWTGGGAWKVRKGQWIDPAAAESLTAIGQKILADGKCSSLPMTLDVSLASGGAYRTHLSHQTGRDVDIQAPKGDDACFAATLAALMSAGWEVWYGGPGAAEITPTHLDNVHITHAHARFKN